MVESFLGLTNIEEVMRMLPMKLLVDEGEEDWSEEEDTYTGDMAVATFKVKTYYHLCLLPAIRRGEPVWELSYRTDDDVFLTPPVAGKSLIKAAKEMQGLIADHYGGQT